MEKYAVVLEDKVKVAEPVDKKPAPTCPRCDSDLEEHNQFLMFCNKCGTEPFEKTK